MYVLAPPTYRRHAARDGGRPLTCSVSPRSVFTDPKGSGGCVRQCVVGGPCGCQASASHQQTDNAHSSVITGGFWRQNTPPPLRRNRRGDQFSLLCVVHVRIDGGGGDRVWRASFLRGRMIARVFGFSGYGVRAGEVLFKGIKPRDGIHPPASQELFTQTAMYDRPCRTW